jgi:hypothetical protein
MKRRLILVVALALVALPSAAAHRADTLRLKQCVGAPPKLRQAVYRTSGGFLPVTVFRVPSGWYGCQGSPTSWGIGRELDTAAERLNAFLATDVLGLPRAKAVAKFKALKILVAGPSTVTSVGGFSGIAFHAKVKGEHAPLTALGIDADIPGDTKGEQIFLSVRGKTLLIRTELAPGTTVAGRVELQHVLRSIRFPR